jgi:hypothetical protein
MKQITIKLSEEDADAMAMLAKRFSWSDAERVACSRYPSQTMIDAIGALQEALRENGFAHR